MRAIPEPLNSNIIAGTAKLCTIWEVTRSDGTQERYTDHDADIVAMGYTWSSLTSYDSTTALARQDMSVLTSEFSTGVQDGVTLADVEAEKYDDAQIILYAIDWSSPSDGVVPLLKGWVGNITVDGQMIKFEFRSLAQKLQQNVGRTIAESCDADVGDSRCKVDLTPFTVTGTAQSGDQYTLNDPTLTQPNGWFAGGRLTIHGVSREVRNSTSTGVILFYDPLPTPIAANDAYSMTPGCDKSMQTCNDKYNNIVNNRGFLAPGGDVAYSVASSS